MQSPAERRIQANVVTRRQESPVGPSHKNEVVGLLNQIGGEFLDALHGAYPEKGWRVCGPASIALSRIVSSRTGVPVGKGLSGEHIEVKVGIYDPQDQPDRLKLMEEQTYVKYHDGRGNATLIDGIWGLLIGGSSDKKVLVEEHSEPEFDTAIRQKYNIHSFRPDHPQIEAIKSFQGDTVGQRQVDFEVTTNALNDHRATLPAFLDEFGRLHDTNWGKTSEVIKQFAPEWKEDTDKTDAEIRAAADAIFGGRQRNSKQAESRSIMSPPERSRPRRG